MKKICILLIIFFIVFICIFKINSKTINLKIKDNNFYQFLNEKDENFGEFPKDTIIQESQLKDKNVLIEDNIIPKRNKYYIPEDYSNQNFVNDFQTNLQNSDTSTNDNDDLQLKQCPNLNTYIRHQNGLVSRIDRIFSIGDSYSRIKGIERKCFHDYQIKNGEYFIMGSFVNQISIGGDKTLSSLKNETEEELLFIAKIDKYGECKKTLIISNDVIDSKRFKVHSTNEYDSNDEKFLFGGNFAEKITLINGDVIFSGLSSTGSPNIFPNGLVMIFDSNGQIIWYKTLKSIFQCFIRDITVDKNGNLVVVGYFEKSLYIDNNFIFKSEKSFSSFVISFSKNDGSVNWAKLFQNKSPETKMFFKMIKSTSGNSYKDDLTIAHGNIRITPKAYQEIEGFNFYNHTIPLSKDVIDVYAIAIFNNKNGEIITIKYIFLQNVDFGPVTPLLDVKSSTVIKDTLLISGKFGAFLNFTTSEIDKENIIPGTKNGGIENKEERIHFFAFLNLTTLQWESIETDSEDKKIFSICQSENEDHSFYSVGTLSNDFYVQKYNKNGTTQWTSLSKGGLTKPTDCTSDGSNVYVSSQIQGEITFKNGPKIGKKIYYHKNTHVNSFHPLESFVAKISDKPSCDNNMTTIPTCFGESALSLEVCQTNGNCIGVNNCSCHSGYFGNNCDLPSCFGILGSNSSVCNSHGYCFTHNKCLCRDGYLGSNCEYYRCNGKEGDLGCNVIACPDCACFNPDVCKCSKQRFGPACEYRIQKKFLEDLDMKCKKGYYTLNDLKNQETKFHLSNDFYPHSHSSLFHHFISNRPTEKQKFSQKYEGNYIWSIHVEGDSLTTSIKLFGLNNTLVRSVPKFNIMKALKKYYIGEKVYKIFISELKDPKFILQLSRYENYLKKYKDYDFDNGIIVVGGTTILKNKFPRIFLICIDTKQSVEKGRVVILWRAISTKKSTLDPVEMQDLKTDMYGNVYLTGHFMGFFHFKGCSFDSFSSYFSSYILKYSSDKHQCLNGRHLKSSRNLIAKELVLSKISENLPIAIYLLGFVDGSVYINQIVNLKDEGHTKHLLLKMYDSKKDLIPISIISFGSVQNVYSLLSFKADYYGYLSITSYQMKILFFWVDGNLNILNSFSFGSYSSKPFAVTRDNYHGNSFFFGTFQSNLTFPSINSEDSITLHQKPGKSSYFIVKYDRDFNLKFAKKAPLSAYSSSFDKSGLIGFMENTKDDRRLYFIGEVSREIKLSDHYYYDKKNGFIDGKYSIIELFQSKNNTDYEKLAIQIYYLRKQTKCPTGTFGKGGGYNLDSCCFPCKIGTYSGESGLKECIPCEKDTYQDEIGQTSCKKCDSHTESPVGSESKNKCVLKEYYKKLINIFIFVFSVLLIIFVCVISCVVVFFLIILGSIFTYYKKKQSMYEKKASTGYHDIVEMLLEDDKTEIEE